MINLTGEQIENAWKEYKDHLVDIGTLKSPDAVHKGNFAAETQKAQTLKMVFKMGFAMGEQNAKLGLQYKVVEEEKKPITRKRTGRNIRSATQIADDSRLIMSILKSAGRPMQLREINEAAKAAGRDWGKSSGSGFVQKAQEIYPTIKKDGFGVYYYEQ